MGGGGGSSHSETVRKRDPDSAEISALQSLLYSQYTPMAGQLGGDYAAAKENAAKYGQQYDKAYGGLADLTESGNLPAGLTDAMNGYITRSMDKSLGSAMAQMGGKGILNSSVTGRAINEIGSNTADAFAKNYMDAYKATSGNYGTLMDAAGAAQKQQYDNLTAQYAPLMEFFKTVRASEDQDDYDTVVYQDGGK